MSITVTWSAMLEYADEPSVRRRTTQILAVCDPPPELAAATVLKWWFEADEPKGWGSNWDEEVGADETSATAHVVIHEPSEFAGCYEVRIERVLQAHGYHTAPDMAAEIMAALAKEPA